MLRTTIKFDRARANHMYIITLGEVSTYIEPSVPNPHVFCLFFESIIEDGQKMPRIE